MIITVLLCLAAAFNSFFGIILTLMHLHHHHQQHFFPAYPMHREQELHILFAVVVVDPYLIVIADMVCVVVALSASVRGPAVDVIIANNDSVDVGFIVIIIFLIANCLFCFCFLFLQHFFR